MFAVVAPGLTLRRSPQAARSALGQKAVLERELRSDSGAELMENPMRRAQRSAKGVTKPPGTMWPADNKRYAAAATQDGPPPSVELVPRRPGTERGRSD